MWFDAVTFILNIEQAGVPVARETLKGTLTFSFIVGSFSELNSVLLLRWGHC